MPKLQICLNGALILLTALLCGGAWYTKLISISLTHEVGLAIQHPWSSREVALGRGIPGAADAGSDSLSGTQALYSASALTEAEVQALVQAAAAVTLAVAAAAALPGGEDRDGESQGQGCAASGFCSLGKTKEWTGMRQRH